MALTAAHRFLTFVVLMIGLSFAWAPTPASAHNSLLGSEPSNGAQLTEAPRQIVWTFDRAVPLETMSATLVEASGARRDLVDSFHGEVGETVVVTPLPLLEDGPFTVRWRLVSADGHAITGRVNIVVTSGLTDTASPAAAVVVDFPDDDPVETPSALRWLTRYLSYLAIITVVGLLTINAWVHPGLIQLPRVRRLLGLTLGATGALALLQVVILASDATGLSL